MRETPGSYTRREKKVHCTLKINGVKYLYHGTNQQFEEFDLGKAKRFKDFGRGFYLTSDLAQAQRWAQIKSREAEKAYVYRYELASINSNEWKVLELLQYNREWVDFISQCRIKGMETDHDIIYDRMADSYADDLTKYLQDYITQKTTAEDVIEKIKWGERSRKDQYCFKNKRAIELLQNRKVLVLEKEGRDSWNIQERGW